MEHVNIMGLNINFESFGIPADHFAISDEDSPTKDKADEDDDEEEDNSGKPTREEKPVDPFAYLLKAAKTAAPKVGLNLSENDDNLSLKVDDSKLPKVPNWSKTTLKGEVKKFAVKKFPSAFGFL